MYVGLGVPLHLFFGGYGVVWAFCMAKGSCVKSFFGVDVSGWEELV